ncbi:MAG: hypothetical protein QXP77_01245 [Candidatus Aenigmatarchaeota archaeon]
MGDIGIILAALPIMLITALLLGFEPPFYYGISLVGFSFWNFSETKRIKQIGLIICFIGLILFSICFFYYYLKKITFPENPFNFFLLTSLF